MALDRRTFLKLAGGACGIPVAAAVREPRALIRAGGLGREARAVIRAGELGRVAFCRASRKNAGWLRFLLDGAMPVCERIERDELVLCGTEATLVVDRSGYRRFA
jgi:hypothetical protein